MNQFGHVVFQRMWKTVRLLQSQKQDTMINVVIRSIAAGEHHSLILSQDGDLYSCGRLDMFEVGIPKDNLPEDTYKDVHGKARAVPLPTK